MGGLILSFGITIPAPLTGLARRIRAATGRRASERKLKWRSSRDLTHALEAAANLSPGNSWQSLQTNNAHTSGNLNFLDTSATNFPQRFYRVKRL